MNSTEIQALTIQGKYASKIELEKLRHKNILEEIEALRKAKIKSFERNAFDQQSSKKSKQQEKCE